MKEYALIAIPGQNVDMAFHYRVPAGILLEVGRKVIVPFGRGNKKVDGYVVGFAERADIPDAKIKDIIFADDDLPFFNEELLKLAYWMNEKYFCGFLTCLKCIIPTKVKLRAKAKPQKDSDPQQAPVLTKEQQKALLKIRKGGKKPFLLHGVTGSGKTEVYLKLIEDTISSGKEAILLVPEISLTPQNVNIFISRFGRQVLVTHSRLSQGERYEVWKRAWLGDASIMIGPRSAVFTPFRNLGAIIIDEEHEKSYHSDYSPKYSTKDVAIFRAELTGATIVLGSATPSLESYYAAGNNALNLITLTERVNKKLPEVYVEDMRTELACGNTSVFSRALHNSIAENLHKGEQTILFLNRRGFSTFVSCRGCGYVMSCEDCNVNFTYHLHRERLICHYCGKDIENPANCPQCGSKYIRHFGLGTQRLEEEVKKIFPTARTLRMDLDTTTGKHRHETILSQFRKGEADILIGTQMIAKGLHFPKVSLVGIVAADISLNNGDFRSGENTFQLLTQVSGRAGRAELPGKVYIQTYNPKHYSIIYAKENDYLQFYHHEMTLRRQLNYPPYTHIFSILFIGESEKNVITLLHRLLEIMNFYNRKGNFEMLGPAPAVISKIKKKYRWRLIVKAEDDQKLKNFVLYCMDKLTAQENMDDVTQNLTLNPPLIN